MQMCAWNQKHLERAATSTSSVDMDVKMFQIVAAKWNVLTTYVGVQGQQPPTIIFLIEAPLNWVPRSCDAIIMCLIFIVFYNE